MCAKTVIIAEYTQWGMPSKFNIQFKVLGVILLTAVQFIQFILIKKYRNYHYYHFK